MVTGFSGFFRKTSKVERFPLLELDFEVVYKAGIKYQAPDALSRFKQSGMDKTRIEEELPVLIIDGIEEQGNVKTKYFGEDRPCKE